MIVTTEDRPGVRLMETNPARSNSSRPREAENRERPNSAQSSNASSKSADRLHPAKSQQTEATWTALPGSREAGSHQLQGIGPYNGRRFGPASGSGRFKTETANLQPGSREADNNSAVWRPGRAESTEIRKPFAIAARPQRLSDGTDNRGTETPSRPGVRPREVDRQPQSSGKELAP
jgi:hypothetical protein